MESAQSLQQRNEGGLKMLNTQVAYKKICDELLRAESEQEVTQVLEQHQLLDPRHWKPLGNMPNNRSIVNNQQQDPTGALVEKIINSEDAMLTKECFLNNIVPDSPGAPQTMAEAAKKFFKIPDGNLANLTAGELTRFAENIQVVATGKKSEPSYLIIDKGEGQVPARFEDTFLVLQKSNKGGIPFVQGKFNCGGTGVLPFCGAKAYQLIVSKRCPGLPSNPAVNGSKDSTYDQWGFTLIRKLPASAGLYNTMVYMYLAPNGEIPCFEAKEIFALPEVGKETIGEESGSEEEELSEESSMAGNGIPRPYRMPIQYGTIIKLYSYRWSARSLATRDVRFALERYLYHLSLPVRIIETRAGYKAHYFATTVAGTSVTISKDREKGFLEDYFPIGGEIQPEGIGTLPISISLYRERLPGEKKAKATKGLPKGLYFTINGQVHYSLAPEFFVTRGMKYEVMKETLLVTVDCTVLPQDIRDELIMPSRDRLRKIPEFETILESIVADLKDRPVLKAINDDRKLRRVKEALTEESVQDVFQSLINKDPVFASIFKNGKGLRNPFGPGPEPPNPPYVGKLPPTYFHFENGKHEIKKAFSIDRTCTVEVETDAVNGYFELPNPLDRGELTIEPKCYERWNLWKGHLRIVLRAPSNARIGDSLDVTITVTDPLLKIKGNPPWINHLTLTFAEGGKEVKPGGPKQKHREGGSLGLPKVIHVYKDKWEENNFNERSALKIQKDDGSYIFYVNMDNKYLHNELLRRKDPEKETAKFAYQWGLVLISLGMLQELKKEELEASKVNDEEDDPAPLFLEEQVGRFSCGVAAVIIPTVLNLMEVMKTQQEAVPPLEN
jgi:hypothetical protein